MYIHMYIHIHIYVWHQVDMLKSTHIYINMYGTK